MERALKVATPLTALTVLVPLKVPPPGFVPMATVIEAVLPVTTLPFASSTNKVTAGLIETPATVVVGCWPNTSCVAVPAVILKAPLVAEVRPLLVAPVNPVLDSFINYPAPAEIYARSLHDALPISALTVLVPLKVPPPGFVPMATVIEAVLPVTTLPPASCTCTVTAGVIEEAAVAFDGCVPNTSLAAAPTVMLNVLLAAPVRPLLLTAKV